MPFKKISADEARSRLDRRKEFLRDTASGTAIMKARTAPPSWNAEKRSARFVMSSESVDRYRDIVVQSGLETERFMENPQGLMFHNSRSWPIGNWSDIKKILGGRPKRTEGVLTLIAEGLEPDADRAAAHIEAGTIRTVSIGFIPDWDEVELITDDDDQWTGGFRYPKSELIECSLVPIPAQPDALVKEAGGDMQLARELIEDVLDNWARGPEGLLIPRSEFEAKYLDVVGERSTYVVDETLAPPAREGLDGLTLEAETDEEAAALVGAKVKLKADVEVNAWDPFKDLGDAEGRVVESYIVQDGDNQGTHALCVEYVTDDYQGMFRGIRAERFDLVPLEEERDVAEAAAAQPQEPDALDEFLARANPGDEIDLKLDTAEGIHWRVTIDRGEGDCETLDAPDVYVAAKKVLARRVELEEQESDAAEIIVPLRLDSSQFDEELDRIEHRVEGIGAKIAKFFLGEGNDDDPAPPAPEVVASARDRAGDQLARLREAGHI